LKPPRPGAGFAVGAVACLLVLTCAQGAEAAYHYASPSGSGMACTSSNPCSLREAALKAWANDDVILAPGNYSIGSEPVVVRSGAQGVFIHGDDSGAMPHIDANVEKGAPILFEDSVGRLGNLEIVNEAPEAYAASCIFEGVVERVHLVARGPDAVGLFQGPGCSVRDSLLRAEGDRATALKLTDSETSERTTALARNVTAIATGPDSKGVRVEFLGVGPTFATTLLLQNSIASGAGYDLYVSAYDVGEAKAAIFVANSNFDTTICRSPGYNPPIVYPPGSLDAPAEILEDTGNQAAPPLFVDAAAGDFREAAGSPTIDGGKVRESDLFDLAGAARVLGPAPDIGAYEFVPAAPPPPRPAARGRITSLKLTPPRFQAVGAGDRARPGQPGTMVSYRLTAATRVRFVVEHRTLGRLVKGKCRRQTRFNDYGRPCRAFLREKPTFSRRGGRGANRFRFRGRLGHEVLEPGTYRLTASAGGAKRRALFHVVD
jgi:hypothetical protein